MRAIKPIFEEKRALFSNLSLVFCVFNRLLLRVEYDKINKLKKNKTKTENFTVEKA